jgi:SAM-dependent methyltransferase
MSESLLTGQAPYAAPRVVTRLEDCFFYHTIEVPGYGLVEGPWDLRAAIGDYLGHVPLGGKRVLELGTASGFVCFHMEREGADVVAYDLSPEHAHLQNVVVFPDDDLRRMAAEYSSLIHLVNNGWWLCHRAFQSSARVVYGDVYDVPGAIGTVDVAMFGCILLHLRDPFLALASALRMVRETVIVTEPFWMPPLKLPPPAPRLPAVAGWRRHVLRLAQRICGDPLWKHEVWLRQLEEHLRQYGERMAALPILTLLPDYRRREPKDAWWQLSPNVVRELLGILGFEDSRVALHSQQHSGRPMPMFTVVARRTKPSTQVVGRGPAG